MNFCECGCGNIPKGRNSRYCRGHNHHSEETRKLIGMNSGKARLGKKRDHYKSISGDKHWQFQKDKHPWNYKLTKETDERVLRNGVNSGLSHRGRKQSKESSEKKSVSGKGVWSDPIYRSRMKTKAKEVTNRPEVKLKFSVKSKERWVDPEYKERQRESRLKSWDGNFIRKELASKRLEKVHKDGKIDYTNPKRLEKIAEKVRRQCGNFSGINNFEPYTEEFSKTLKEQIRQRDNYQCQECRYFQKDLGYKLPIHHIDYNKKNNDPLNLISLCKSCHCKTNFNRDNWTNYYKKKV